MRNRARSITGRLVLLIVIVYVASSVALVALVRDQLREHVLADARDRADLLITRNLAIHSYFNHELKPELFGLTDPVLDDGSFEPSWMSSTYAVRRIASYADTGSGAYYYKECAIDARSPENEADTYEAEFLRALNADPVLEERAGVRAVDGEQVFYLLKRGEVMEEQCLLCHSTPDVAPAELVAYYGPDRSFGREVGEVASALSIRIPLEVAYAGADGVAIRLSGMLLGLLLVTLAVMFAFARREVIRPLALVGASAREIASGTRPLRDGVRASGPSEIRELAGTIDELALEIDRRITELEAANAQVVAANAARDRFLANLSHELRTPLNSVIGFAGTMKQELAGPLTAEQRTQLDMIANSGRHLLGLVEELLEYSALDAGVERVTVSRFKPCETVVGVVGLFQPAAAERGLELEAGPCVHDHEAHTDRSKVEQILINLVGNAVKFAEHGTVTVSPSLEGDVLRIDVADAGPGIPPDRLDAVFEEFTQVRTGDVAKPTGTGLGLAISRAHARLLGGDITVESVVGAGSTFTLRIPLRYPDASTTDAPIAEKDRPGGDGPVG